ncbi:transposable element Tcb2 transposase, partial [Trichonephila clavipes]
GGQLDGWKWDCREADAARRLNVSRSVVQRLWDQYQSEDSVSRRPVPADHEPHHTCRRPFSSSLAREKATTVPQLVAGHFHIREKYSATTVRNRFTMQVRMQEDQLCAFPSTDDSEGIPLMLGKRTCFLTHAATMGLLYCSQTSPDLQWESDSRRLCLEWNSALDTINPTLFERHSYRGWWNPLVWQGSRSVATLELHTSMEEP